VSSIVVVVCEMESILGSVSRPPLDLIQAHIISIIRNSIHPAALRHPVCESDAILYGPVQSCTVLHCYHAAVRMSNSVYGLGDPGTKERGTTCASHAGLHPRVRLELLDTCAGWCRFCQPKHTKYEVRSPSTRVCQAIWEGRVATGAQSGSLILF
jgi:hypothetical protein